MISNILNIQEAIIANETVPSVDARKLHEALKSGRDFSAWIKQQIDRAYLVENQDFIIFTKKGEYRKPLTEYLLSLDSAKHIAMMSGSARGLAVRKYFIDVEKKYRVAPTAEDPTEIMAKALLYAQKRLAIVEPKATLVDKCCMAEDVLPLYLAARKFDMTTMSLSNFLLATGVFKSIPWDSHQNRRVPKANYVGKYFINETSRNTQIKTYVTEEGINLIQDLLEEYREAA